MRRCVVTSLLRFRYNGVLKPVRAIYTSALRSQEKVQRRTTNPIVESLRYERKSPIEHILLRPDTYVGSTGVAEHADAWVVSEDNQRMVQKKMSYSPALLKIFDEILVNAADNKQRDPEMDQLCVNVDRWVNQ
ncbi:unnamed protein product [Strongylus vulgaris]|uniref:DNA topoisomerase (ATP-hydrolyzing) n=1 Tax=Strongylus vulgaris TaxID=40348 RepID=A0A3P7ISQ5_STRVU|nr:unnamed protein product [Strongylus vulgaris]